MAWELVHHIVNQNPGDANCLMDMVDNDFGLEGGHIKFPVSEEAVSINRNIGSYCKMQYNSWSPSYDRHYIKGILQRLLCHRKAH